MPSLIDEHQQFKDELSNTLIVNGYIYVGVKNQDPTVLANQVTIYSDRALTIPIANPQRTGADGRAVNKIWVTDDYSITVQDSALVQKYTEQDAGSFDASNTQFIPEGTGAVPTTVDVVLKQRASLFGFMTDAEIADVESRGEALDVSTAIQNAFNWGFVNKRKIYGPSGTFRTDKPVIVYGYDVTEDTAGQGFEGESKGGTIIKKHGSANAGTGFTYDANCIMMISNEDGFNSIENATGRARHLQLQNFTLEGNSNDVTYGLYQPVRFSNSDVRNVNVKSITSAGVYLNNNNFVNTFHMMRIDCDNGVGVSDYGFQQDTGTVTSTILSNIYVLSSDVAAFRLKGDYCTTISCAADSNIGVVYELNRYKGTMISPGNESILATRAFKIEQLSDVVIIGANSLGNHTDATAAHIEITGGGKAKFIGGRLGFDGADDDNILPGKMFTTDSGIGSLHFDNVDLARYAQNDVANPGRPFVSYSGDQGRINVREGVDQPYIGYDRNNINFIYTGTHTDSGGASVLTDSAANDGEGWQTNALIGQIINNTTDGSSAHVTANTATTITGALNGGTDDDWDNLDAYTLSFDQQHVDDRSNIPLIQGKAIFMDSEDDPWRDNAGVSHATSTRVNKGDFMLANNPLDQGALGWVCTEDGSRAYTTLGEISSVSINDITLSDVTLDAFAGQGMILHNQDVTNESGGTGTVASVNFATDVVTISSKAGTWTGGIGDHIIVSKPSQLSRCNFKKVPIIMDGITAHRPTTSLVIGQPYFDTTLDFNINWNGTVWKDGAGNTV